MNRMQLLSVLDEKGVPSSYYSIKGAKEDRVCLDSKEGKWVVFYIERGNKDILGEFDTEDEACAFMLDKLTMGG
jgi:hypothetical protein